MARSLTALMLAVVSVSAHGAEIVVRATVELHDSIVRLGDVAEIVSLDVREAEELAAISLLPAPAPGTQMFLSTTQLRDLLAASAVEVGALQIRGAATAAITTPPIDVARSGGAQAPLAAAPVDRAEASRQVAAGIVQYLKNQTGHELWEVTVNLDPKLLELCGASGQPLAIGGGAAPWTGRQRFDVMGRNGIPSARAHATVVRLEMVVVAVRAIAAGDFVRATDVALQPQPGPATGQIATSLDQVVGKEARQAIRPDAPLLLSQLRSPLLVRKGERVAVRARAASVVVRTYGTVQQDGSLGELVQVQALEGRERYAARVSGVRELEIYAAGASANDVAAAAKQ